MIENLGLFFYTLIADDKYSLPNKDKLLQLIQMQLSQKKKLFPNFFPLSEIYIEVWTFSSKRSPS